jgi:hypothetical protein
MVLLFPTTDGCRNEYTRRNHRTRAYLVRQDQAHRLWWQNGLSSLLNNWKHTERNQAKALSPRLYPPRIFTMHLTGAYNQQVRSSTHAGQLVSLLFRSYTRAS